MVIDFCRAVPDCREGVVVLRRQTGVAGASDVYLSALGN